MYKQSPIRNNRSKGIKVKNVLQICLLLAVCFWLIYQVKHSHDKKKEFEEDDIKSSIKTENNNELMKLGRKDLLPRIEGLGTVNEKQHREEPEDETVEEEEGNKPEEEDLEENNIKEKNDEHREDGEDEVDDHDQEKNHEHREDGEDEVDDHDQEKNDEHREDGEDEVDDHDHDHEKSDVERDQEEDTVDEDKEQGEDNEKETEERDSEVNDSQVEEENSLEDHDHDEDSSSSHEAREEHYKADDASSAVTHDTVVTTTDNESDKLEQEAENAAEAKSEVGVNNIMQINASQNAAVDLNGEDGKADGEDSPPNTTNSEEKHDDPISSTAADTSVSNSTRTEGLTNNSELTTHSTELSTQTHDLLLQNETQAVNQEHNATVGDTTSGGSNMSTVNQEHNATVGDTTSGGSNMSISSSQQNGNSADTMDDNQIDSNLTFSSKNDKLNSIPVDSSNVSGDTDLSLAENVVQLPLKDNNATEVEKADTSHEEFGTNDEDPDASIAENLGEVQDDLIDTSDSSTHLEEKHIRTDVETLPEIQTEGNMEDAAAE